MAFSGFPTDTDSIQKRIAEIDPVAYGRTRNFTDGKVTGLSPYISRGFISTNQVLESLILRGFGFNESEILVKELAWRDHFQRTWQHRDVSLDLRLSPFTPSRHTVVPSALMSASTGIEGVDEAIRLLLETGYMHNHCRMYVASLACNLAGCHWLTPAKWMYYHLLDGDWASNACSWQWVAGTNSSKRYFANQENISRFTGTNQRGTWLDIPLEILPEISIPDPLEKCGVPDLQSTLPTFSPSMRTNDLPVCVYNYYNLDPLWRRESDYDRILLLEPSVFDSFPVGGKPFEFFLKLAGQIEGLRFFTGTFDELKTWAGRPGVIFKEHPLNRHYNGICDSRDWMVSEVDGIFPSFSAYWKKVGPMIQKRFLQGKT